MRRLRTFNVLLTVLLSAFFILLAVFVFNNSYLRFWESLVDFWNSIRFYFYELFGIPHKTIPTVDGYSKIMTFDIFLAEDWEGFKEQATSYFSLLLAVKTLATIGL